MTKGRFEVSYSESGVEKEIPGLAEKTIASAEVVHKRFGRLSDPQVHRRNGEGLRL